MSIDFDEVAGYYDAMYVQQEEYEREAKRVLEIALRYNKSGSNALLDIACGTGGQSEYLARDFHVTGIDLSEEMLRIARSKVPKAEFIKADMFDFSFGQTFGCVVNLYGSIGFASSAGQMEDGLRCVYRCLKPGGVFLLTPWGIGETFREGTIAQSGECGAIKFCRMESVKRETKRSVLVDMYHLIAKDGEIREFHNTQHITLFAETEYIRAIKNAGFTIRERLAEEKFRMGAFVCTK